MVNVGSETYQKSIKTSLHNERVFLLMKVGEGPSGRMVGLRKVGWVHGFRGSSKGQHAKVNHMQMHPHPPEESPSMGLGS